MEKNNDWIKIGVNLIRISEISSVSRRCDFLRPTFKKIEYTEVITKNGERYKSYVDKVEDIAKAMEI